MNLGRKVRIQITVFLVVTCVATGFMVFDYMKLQQVLFGVGQYKVTLELSNSSGLYKTARVSYRGQEIGEVDQVTATRSGARAILVIDSSVHVPSDLVAQVHSRSAVGEQYVDLLPRNADSPPLRAGSVIPVGRTSEPPDIGVLFDGINRTLESVPQQQLQTTIDSAYLALNDRGPDIRRLIESFANLAGDAHGSLDASSTLIEESGKVLRSQASTGDSIRSWARNLSTVTREVADSDGQLRDILRRGPATAEQATELLQEIKPTFPALLGNLVSVGSLAVTYNASLEQTIMLLPRGTEVHAATTVPNRGTDLNSAFLSFNLNLNLPQPCTTGYLPSDQRRSPDQTDTPDRPAGNFYCRIPQSAGNVVRGMRNLPCITNPGKRAPTAAMCRSGTTYTPLNDGRRPVGDPNGSDNAANPPQYSPMGSSRQIDAVAEYDPSTGEYVGPDGRMYKQADLADRQTKEQTWQTLLMPTGR